MVLEPQMRTDREGARDSMKSTRQPLFLSCYNAAQKLAPLISYLFLSTAPQFLSWDFLIITSHPLCCSRRVRGGSAT
jgi:hypothetical protein